MADSVTTHKLDFTGFQPEAINKVRRLLVALDRIHSHPFLSKRVCLHGGTAINLFFLNMPRLSVDIDLNYIGSFERGVMYEDRPSLEKNITDIGRELGYKVVAGSEEHSGRSFKFHYQDEFGSSNVKIDVDYLNRSPLLPPVVRAIETPEGDKVEFPVNSDIELIGGKAKALLSRVAPRDLYDIYRIAGVYQALMDSHDALLLRRILLYYASLSDPFPKPFEVTGRFSNREREVNESLYPMLLDRDRPSLQAMIDVAAQFISTATHPQEETEQAYLDNAAAGVFKPELLFADYPETLNAARHDPSALWKMQNIKKML